jgi:hypothetical protein
MSTNRLSSASHLSNAELLTQVKRLAAGEREATVALIAHLAEVDARRLYLGEGCSSLFTWCTQVLHLAEDAAYKRIAAARAARRYPVVLERLADGSVNLATVCLLAPHLTAANHRELLDRARRRSKRDVEALVAELRPQPPVPATVRKLPGPRPSMALESAPASSAAPAISPVPAAASSPPAPLLTPPTRPLPLPQAHRPVVAPLAPERYRVQFTASAETYAKLRRAQDLLRHQIPDGDVGQVLDRALTVLVKHLEKQKFAATDRPRKPQRPARDDGRPIPADVKRAVRERDQDQCAFVSREGRRCTERGFLEFHHAGKPYARGGKATVENVQLRCRPHNVYEAELVFGPHGPWVVREPARAYGRPTQATAPTSAARSTRSGPSCAPRRQWRGRRERGKIGTAGRPPAARFVTPGGRTCSSTSRCLATRCGRWDRSATRSGPETSCS